MTTNNTPQPIETPSLTDETPVKKLKLHKMTLLDLSDRELDAVKGGGPNTRTCSVRLKGCA